ncbi:MAG: hypothetical protein ABSA33_04355, partial [Candidatus Micrarchaeaceae archaeon]
ANFDKEFTQVALDVSHSLQTLPLWEPVWGQHVTSRIVEICAEAIAAQHLIDPKDYRILTQPWRTVIGEPGRTAKIAAIGDDADFANLFGPGRQENKGRTEQEFLDTYPYALNKQDAEIAKNIVVRALSLQEKRWPGSPFSVEDLRMLCWEPIRRSKYNVDMGVTDPDEGFWINMRPDNPYQLDNKKNGGTVYVGVSKDKNQVELHVDGPKGQQIGGWDRLQGKWIMNQDGALRRQSKTSSADELHVSLEIPRHSAKALFRWAREQRWPDGTKLEDPNEYHITLLYSPVGHEQWGQEGAAWWIKDFEQAKVNILGMEAFPSHNELDPAKTFAYVLRVESPAIKEAAEEMQERAQQMGLPIHHFEGGYKPHITLGYGPSEFTGIEAPTYSFDVGPSSISEPRKESSVKLAWEGDPFGDLFGAKATPNQTGTDERMPFEWEKYGPNGQAVENFIEQVKSCTLDQMRALGVRTRGSDGINTAFKRAIFSASPSEDAWNAAQSAIWAIARKNEDWDRAYDV